MTEEVETSFWISFFVEAGIPPAASANYAIIFTDNRIQKHMLLDLNKEYLKDMGVNVLGDIIAILKHAKLYHEKVAREKVLASKGSTTVSVKKATEHLNELLLKEEPVKPVTAATSKPASTSVRAVLKPSPPKKLRVLKSEIEIVEKEEESPDEELEELKRKVIPPSKQPQQQTKKMSAVSVQPSNKKTSVFERLGDSSVTSTTPEAPDSSAAAAAKSSVFQRLGKSLKASETEEVKAPLKLQTTVSTQPVTKKAIAAKPAKAMPEVTLRMDMEEASKQSAKERLTLRIGAEKSKEMKRVVSNKSSAGAGGIILKTSLQRTVRPPTVVSQTIKPKTVAVKPRSTASSTKSSLANRAGVKQRLGSVATVAASASSVGSSVFKRLGTTRN